MVDGQSVIDLVETNGTGSQRVDVDFPIARPNWRPPDGRQLLFRGLGSDGFWRLYLWDRAEAKATQLDVDHGFETKAVVHECGGEDCIFNETSWSPDGQTLAFTTVEPSPDAAALFTRSISPTTGDKTGYKFRISQISP